jgi:hypothetical protein
MLLPDWLRQLTSHHPNAPAWIQAASAVVTLLVTIPLAVFAYRSVKAAEKSVVAANRGVDAALEGLKASQRGLTAAEDAAETSRENMKIAKALMDLEWTPDVRIAGIAKAGTAIFAVRVANLGMKAVFVEHILLVGSKGEMCFAFEHLIPSGTAAEISLAQAFTWYGMRAQMLTGGSWTERFKVCLEFKPTGRPAARTEWREYDVFFANMGFNTASLVGEK